RGPPGKCVPETASKGAAEPGRERSHAVSPDVIEHRDERDVYLQNIRELSDQRLVHVRAASPGYGEGRSLQDLLAARGRADDRIRHLARGHGGSGCNTAFVA